MNIPPDWKVGYGYQFWLSRHGYRGDGASGQYALMLPGEDMAIAITSCCGNMQDILTALWEELIPAVQGQALPENPAGAAELAGFFVVLLSESVKELGQKFLAHADAVVRHDKAKGTQFAV